MRYIAAAWDTIPAPPEAFTPCCFYHSIYAYHDYLMIEASEPHETNFIMPVDGSDTLIDRRRLGALFTFKGRA